MVAPSTGIPEQDPPVMSRLRWPVAAGPFLVLIAIIGLWWSSVQEENRVVDQSDAALARHVAAFLRVLTPAGPGDSYDAPRLLSSANSLADASFWRGGLQISMGSVPLIPDTIGLLPLPDSLMAPLEQGAAAVVATHARHRATLVPFLSRDRQSLLGWVAAWDSVELQVPRARHLFLTVAALIGLGAATVTLVRYTRPNWRVIAILSEMGLLGLLALTLWLSVHSTASTATDTRLLTLRRLVEIAATAAGVQQARLPEIGAGTFSRKLSAPLVRPDDVIRGEVDSDTDTPIARIVAATPRNQGGLEFRVVPAESDLENLGSVLLAWLALAAAGLGLTATGGKGPPPGEAE
jgi:hypothetical protein